MTTFELQMRLDRSIPFNKLEGFPRFLSWKDAETVTTSDPSISVRLVMGKDLESLSPRWEAVYRYGVTSEVDAEGNPVFRDFPHGHVEATAGALVCSLQDGSNYILVERSGGTLRDWKAGEAVPGASIWSKAKVSGYLIVHVE